MSKVDWHKAELEYITDPKVSYDYIAKKYKVAKSTVVRRAKKYFWQQSREEYQYQRIAMARKARLRSAAEVDEKHLKMIQHTQGILNTQFLRLAVKYQEEGRLSPREFKDMMSAESAMIRYIELERKILGLPTKAVRLSNTEDINDYLEKIGLVETSPLKFYKEAEQTYKDGKLLQEHLNRMKKYMGDWGAHLD